MSGMIAHVWHGPPAWGGAGKNFRKVFTVEGGGFRNFYFDEGGGENLLWGGGGGAGGGSHNFEVKIKTA